MKSSRWSFDRGMWEGCLSRLARCCCGIGQTSMGSDAYFGSLWFSFPCCVSTLVVLSGSLFSGVVDADRTLFLVFVPLFFSRKLIDWWSEASVRKVSSVCECCSYSFVEAGLRSSGGV